MPALILVRSQYPKPADFYADTGVSTNRRTRYPLHIEPKNESGPTGNAPAIANGARMTSPITMIQPSSARGPMIRPERTLHSVTIANTSADPV